MLNLPRVNLRSAANFMQGFHFTRGGQLPYELFDALAWSEEEARGTHLDVNSERAIAEALAEARG